MSTEASSTTGAGAPPPISTNTTKGGKKGKKKERRSGRRNREICDIFGEAAMTNAYNISHSVQDMLYFRGFPWSEKKK